MHIRDIFSQHTTTCSFEFFPPKTKQGFDALFATVSELEPLQPAFVSITYGAGGSTRDLTHDLVVRIKQKTQVEAIPHLTCVCHTAEEIEGILTRYANAGVSNVLALGGDAPRDRSAYQRSQDEFQHAKDLVEFIRRFRLEGEPRGFGIGVAGCAEGHPATPNRLDEMDHFKAKIDAGADYVVTQLFFDNRDFYDFRERCELAGITVPIVAGIMPITTVAGMKRMAQLALGARFPAALQRAIARTEGDPEAVERIGVHWATEQCRDLVDHQVRGIHFYTLNKSRATLEIYRSLGISNSNAL